MLLQSARGIGSFTGAPRAGDARARRRRSTYTVRARRGGLLACCSAGGRAGAFDAPLRVTGRGHGHAARRAPATA